MTPTPTTMTEAPEFSESDMWLLASAIENLRGGGSSPETRVEAAFRIASKLDGLYKRIEAALSAAPPAPAPDDLRELREADEEDTQVTIEICDAVLQWIVKHDLGQQDDEFTAGDVTSILDDLWGDDDDQPGDPKAAEAVLRGLVDRDRIARLESENARLREDAAQVSDADPEGYKHILHASDCVTTIVVDDEPEHPFEPLEEGDSVETIQLFRRNSLNKAPKPAAALYTLKTALMQIRALESHPTASEEAHGGYMEARNDAALIVEEIIDNLCADDTEDLLSLEEKRAQAARCNCHGSDDYCPCQNAADCETRRQRKMIRAAVSEPKP